MNFMCHRNEVTIVLLQLLIYDNYDELYESP
jgi:hypothetical protein